MRESATRTGGLLFAALLSLSLPALAGEDAVTTFEAARALAAAEGTLVLVHTTSPG
jgi:hypothetical protein